MAKKFSFVASRHSGLRLFRWSLLALAGVVGGMLLGEMAVGTRLGSGVGVPTPYSRLSANPDAAAPQSDGAPPCLGCPDSYGVAARLRADRDHRMSDEFRELGAVDVDPPAPVNIDDGYRYGGRFPDVAPRITSEKTEEAARVPAIAPEETPPVAGAPAQPVIY